MLSQTEEVQGAHDNSEEMEFGLDSGTRLSRNNLSGACSLVLKTAKQVCAALLLCLGVGEVSRVQGEPRAQPLATHVMEALGEPWWPPLPITGGPI